LEPPPVPCEMTAVMSQMEMAALRVVEAEAKEKRALAQEAHYKRVAETSAMFARDATQGLANAREHFAYVASWKTFPSPVYADPWLTPPKVYRPISAGRPADWTGLSVD
jgi:hypothetical protein